MRLLLALTIVVFTAVSASCLNPVASTAIDDLGPEAPGVRTGPRHRPGQPCTVCHGPDGPNNPKFSLAGTVFQTRGGTVGIPGVTVSVTDKNGSNVQTYSNDVGNFYLTTSQYQPTYPLTVELNPGGNSKPMLTLIGRETACAICHRGGGNLGQMPGVYLFEVGQ
jgi:hypothetical protein